MVRQVSCKVCLEHNISVSNTLLPMSFTHSCENNKPFTASSLSSAPTSTSQLSFGKSVKSETFISTCLICYFNCIKVINIVYSKMQWSAMYWAYVKYIIGGYALITGQKLDWTSPYIITAGFKLEVCIVGHWGKKGITMVSNGNNRITKPGMMFWAKCLKHLRLPFKGTSCQFQKRNW